MADTMKVIAELAAQQLALDKRIETGEALLTKLRAERAIIAEKQLPEAMDSLDMESFELRDGSTISIIRDVHAYIKLENQKEAFRWLRQHGFGALIKRDVTVKFGKGEDEAAKKLITAIKKLLPKQPLNDKTFVHPQTLLAFVREALREGQSIPLDTFGVEPFTQAKITRPKV